MKEDGSNIKTNICSITYVNYIVILVNKINVYCIILNKTKKYCNLVEYLNENRTEIQHWFPLIKF